MEQNKLIGKYLNEYMDRLNNIPKEELEEKFKKAFSFYDTYNDLNFDSHDLARWDFYKFIEVFKDRYESVIDNKITWSISAEKFDKALQVILEPMRNGDILFYSMALLDFRKGQLVNRHIFNKGTKFARDIVEELEIEEAKKLCSDEQNQRDTDEYAEEHEMECPKCGQVATNQAPNRAGILEECNWHCICCNWTKEDQVKGEQ